MSSAGPVSELFLNIRMSRTSPLGQAEYHECQWPMASLGSLHASACKYTAQIISPPTEFMQRACCKDLWCSAREGSQSDIW